MTRASKPLQLGALAFIVSAMAIPIGLGWGHSLFRKEAPEPGLQVVRHATQGLPPYKQALPQALAADYMGPDSRIAVAWFTTRDAPEEVLGFYREVLGEAGLPVLSHRYDTSAGYVGYRGPGSSELHLVSALRHGEETLVLLSSAHGSSLPQAQREQMPWDLPMPAGVRHPWVMNLKVEGRVRSTAMIEARGARVNDLVDFYLRTFKAQGWTLEHPAERLGDQVFLSARRGPARVSTLIQPQAAGARLYFTLDGP
ncbi:hypothetical protein [Hyalangium sp.]|uniref:hypothetical protein n=1 Tax=Hyalangium sp. TaxID=2028555 RepID=UPI002D6CC3EC|nr:hypothetical protein [Hyalangium sp.]HYH98535.1 hypothetical protein [Hyalangium sp.]